MSARKYLTISKSKMDQNVLLVQIVIGVYYGGGESVDKASFGEKKCLLLTPPRHRLRV